MFVRYESIEELEDAIARAFLAARDLDAQGALPPILQPLTLISPPRGFAISVELRPFEDPDHPGEFAEDSRWDPRHGDVLINYEPGREGGWRDDRREGRRGWHDGAPAELPPPPGEDEEEARSGTAQVGIRGGLWMLPDFKSTIPAGGREFTRTALFDVGVDFSLLFDSVFVGSSIDYALTNELSIFSFSAQAGFEADLGKLLVPLSLRASAGIMLAELDVDEESFGDFDHGVGFLARVELTGRVTSSVVASLWVDYRHIEFDYEPTVLSGDDKAGGATFAVGLSVGLRF